MHNKSQVLEEGALDAEQGLAIGVLGVALHALMEGAKGGILKEERGDGVALVRPFAGIGNSVVGTGKAVLQGIKGEVIESAGHRHGK